MCGLAEGRGEEALAEAVAEPNEAFRLWASAIVHHTLDHEAESEAALQELIEKHAANFAYQVSEVRGERGEAEAAFEWLDRAYAQRDGGLAELRISPRFRSIHGDPRSNTPHCAPPTIGRRIRGRPIWRFVP